MVLNIKNSLFPRTLALISVLGFVAIIAKAGFGLNIDAYFEASIMLIFGITLMISGGALSLYSIFRDNKVSAAEWNRISASVAGIFSVIVGVLTAPFFGVQAPITDAFKVIIAVIAIISILVELLKD